jgi:hypothetical protein
MIRAAYGTCESEHGTGTLGTLWVILRITFCPPCSRSWCRAWSCAWIRLPLPRGSASTLLSPVWRLMAPCHPPPSAKAARADPLTVVASKKCLGVTFAPASSQVFEPVGLEGLRRQWRQPALGCPPQPSAEWDTLLASIELLHSRLLGLDLSAMGRGLGTTGYAEAQVWQYTDFEGISPGRLADMERMLQRAVDGQSPRPDGAAAGWLQGSHTFSWQATLQKWALGLSHH